jgi:glucosylceramidase
MESAFSQQTALIFMQHFLTARDSSDRLTKQAPLALSGEKGGDDASILVDPRRRFQEIEGFGGALTESAAVTLRKLSPGNQKRVMDAYFDPEEGLGYSVCRTHMNSCDFSVGNYACADKAGDVELSGFDINREREALLPMIREAQQMAGFKLFISPWSPPAWMKTNGKMNNGGSLLPEYRDAWARYYVRFIEEYAKEGVDIWGLTVQNEPAAVQAWDSCVYTAEEERDFVRDHLGPTLEKAGLGRVKIMIWDHNRDMLIHRVRVAYDDAEASKYIWGSAIHWYCADKFENLELHHDLWPEKRILFSEGCQEAGPHTGEWPLAERYARSMINDLNRWVVGWVDWNVLLDETGGPNHVGNLCSAPILADTKNDRVLIQSSYYAIGHFARFVRPGAYRVLCATNRDAIEATGFVNPDGSVAVIALNRTEEPQSYTLDLPRGSAGVKVPPRSISTYVLDAGEVE